MSEQLALRQSPPASPSGSLIQRSSKEFHTTQEGTTTGRKLLSIVCSTLIFDWAALYIEDCATGTRKRYLSLGKEGPSESSATSSRGLEIFESELPRTDPLIDKAKQSERNCYWRHMSKDATSSYPIPFPGPYFTEMSLVLNPEALATPDGGALLILVAYNMKERVEIQEVKMNILEGLGKALFFALVQFDSNHKNSLEFPSVRLDQENHEKRSSKQSQSITAAAACKPDDVPKYACVPIAIKRSALLSIADDETCLSNKLKSAVSIEPQSIPRQPTPTTATSSARSTPDFEFPSDQSVFLCQDSTDVYATTGSSPSSFYTFTRTPPLTITPPFTSPSPFQSFRYRLDEIPICNVVPVGLRIEDFKDVRWMGDGTHANLFIAFFNINGTSTKVVIKMIKKESTANSVARREFDAEIAILSRAKSPWVVNFLGAGKSPRLFMVLEWLGGGTLSALLSQNQSISEFFRRPVFTRKKLYHHIRNLADSLRYLHDDFYSEACVVHRDLKPDNIGIGTDGNIKLFDFGLAVCIQKRGTADEKYDMTGFTGSLRYMAPEVASRKPYSETVDQYSFALVVWQMVTGQTPFKGYSRDQLLQEIVREGKRPSCDSKHFTPSLSKLLTACWHPNPVLRPPFRIIVIEMDRMIATDCPENKSGISLRDGTQWF